jgi:hypothetical protein
MRCRNCHTVLMDTDRSCPSCHASRASATADAPGEFKKPSVWVNLLPVFGGAIGGAVAGAVIASSTGSDGATDSMAARRGSSPVKKTFGVILILGGLLFLFCAGGIFYNTWKIAQWVPKEVTAAELRAATDPKTYPGPWLAYTFEASKPAYMIVKRQRLNFGGEVEALGLLVAVEDTWMFVSVARGFDGNRIIGRLSPLDPAVSKILKPHPPALLSCEFNAVDACDSDRRQRYTAAGVSAFLGVLGVWPGLVLCRRRRMA